MPNQLPISFQINIYLSPSYLPVLYWYGNTSLHMYHVTMPTSFFFLPTFIHLYPNPRVNVNNRAIIWKTTGAVVMTIALCSSITFPFFTYPCPFILSRQYHALTKCSIINHSLAFFTPFNSIQSQMTTHKKPFFSFVPQPNTHVKNCQVHFSVEVSGRHHRHEQACKKKSSKSHVQSIQSINLFLSQANCYFLLTKPLLSYVPI